MNKTTDVVEIAGKQFVIDRIAIGGNVFYGCGILPLRADRDALIRDIELAQSPEWRS
jgi:hypothetical protein